MILGHIDLTRVHHMDTSTVPPGRDNNRTANMESGTGLNIVDYIPPSLGSQDLSFTR